MITIYKDLIQGTDEWRKARIGMLTASVMHQVVTPTGKAATNDKSRALVWELLAQRISGTVEDGFVSDDMQRGIDEEQDAIDVYAERYGEVERVGFVVNTRHGVTIGCSPDALVGDNGGVQVKCPRQKRHIETLITNKMPAEYECQVQTELLVTERAWWDYVSHCAGLPLVVIRVLPDPDMQARIIEAARATHADIDAKYARYMARLADPEARLTPTQKRPDLFV
jgi:tetrahydromethanopterin S-methyltransferase subunit B